MAELSKLQQQTTDFTAAYDDRTRLFNRLRDPLLTDEEREKTLKEYAAAAKQFDELRKAIVK